MRYVFLPLLALTALQAAEPSAFGAGNLDSPNPYGLTPSEKHILKNKEMLDDVKQKNRNTESQVDSLRERIDGLQSVVEGLGQKSYDNQMELKALKETYSYDSNERVQSLQELENTIRANEANIVELKKVLESFSGILDSINSSYVSKNEFNALVEDVNEFKKLVAKELKKQPVAAAAQSTPLDKMSNAEIAKEAEAAYDKKYYTKAIEYYEQLIAKNYKPARAHYMIGEMWYKRQDYGKAIAYFKQSASLYGKADYMPTLMLHTAISMEETKDIANAKKFFGAVVTQYPGTSEAAAAQQRLSKLP